MKRTFKTLSLAALLTTIALGGAEARNAEVESTLQSLGDVSMFYHGLISTGLIDEMRENQHYTIFAPTNAAFTDIRPDIYPCFYAVQCRPQIAALLRDHIVIGNYGLKELSTYGSGIATAGAHALRVDEPFVGNYTVDGKRILSRAEVDGNVIYRIDGVLAERQDLIPFRTASYAPDETTVRKTIRTHVNSEGLPDDTTETTTVIQHTTVSE